MLGITIFVSMSNLWKFRDKVGKSDAAFVNNCFITVQI